jgi:hypothetical protein
MTENVVKVLEIFTIVLLLGLAWFIGWGYIMAVQALWHKIKKMETKEKKKHEEIIVGRNQELKKIEGDKEQLEAELKALEERKSAIKDFIRANEKEVAPPDDPKVAESVPDQKSKKKTTPKKKKAA